MPSNWDYIKAAIDEEIDDGGEAEGMTMADLKPCPFCGGEAVGPTDAWPHMITCLQCGAGVKGFNFAEDGKREAVEKWNRRDGARSFRVWLLYINRRSWALSRRRDSMYDYFIPQGWQCPVCGRVYSPSTMACMQCGKSAYTVTDNTSAPETQLTKIIFEMLNGKEG